MAAALLLGLGLVVARLWTVRLVPFAVAAEIATILALIALPRPVRLVAAVIGEASGRLARALGALRPAPVLSIAILAAAGALAAYRLRPVVEIPLGGGRETAFEEGLGSFDARDGVRFRHLPARASLDLRDLGGGGSWRVDVTAALGGPSRSVPLLDLGRGPVAATLGPQWSTHEATAAAPLGWRGGLRLDFPASRRDDIWLHEVRIDRGRVWPPARAVVAIALTSLLMAVALLAGGVAVATAWASAVVVVILESLALLLDPVAAIPELPRLVAIASLGAAVTSVAAAIAGRAERSLLPPAAIAAGGVGFMAWLATSTAPLYRGGHFVFHSSIAEEIWKGRFLLYYLPYPGSMLSQQAQWGNVIVPHPCLYHTLVAPLAALPRPALFAAEKVFLALLLASMVWATAALAARIGPPAAAVPAAVLMAAMPAAYQLLGLGHLMTILGCWAMTLAMTYLVLRIESLGQRGPWWRAVLLLTLCFLAYTAGLLFTGMVIAATALLLARSRPEIARPLVGAAFAAGLLAFALYYVHWTWPFLSESVPRLFTGAGAQPDSSAGALPMRLGALPHKLAYTFGSALLPLVGLSGLLLVRRGPERVLMLAWGAVLPVFMGLDLAFNFLLKHHYFTMVPVAVGGGAALAAIAGRGRAGRVLAAVVLVAVALLGARVALDAAMGRIP